MIRITIIESPYAGDVERNLHYVRACMRDCFDRGEIPFASHALYTQPGVLNDDDPEERSKGIGAGLKLSRVIHEASRMSMPHPMPDVGHTVAFYVDLGWSKGMEGAFQFARRNYFNTKERRLGGEWEQK